MVCPPGYSVLRSDRLYSRGGGVLLIYKNKLTIVNVETSVHDIKTKSHIDFFELVCIDLYNGTSKFRFCCFYVPPKSSHCLSTTKLLCNIIHNLNVLPVPVFIFGDFNFPYIDWCSLVSSGDPAHEFFLHFCVTNCLSQHIDEPTHDQGNILDLLLCNYSSKNFLISTTVLPSLSASCDHSMIAFTLLLSSNVNQQSSFQYPDFSKANFPEINNTLRSHCWNHMSLQTTSLQYKYDHFLSVINTSLSKNVPLKTTTTSKSHKKPRHIKLLLKHKLYIYKKLKRDPSFKTAYKEACRAYDSAVNKWYDQIEHNICINTNTKKFYNYVNKKLKTKSSIPPLLDSNNKLLFSNLDKANLLNSSFQKTFTTDDSRIPPTPLRQSELMPSFNITKSDVLLAVSRVKDKISRTPEGIPSYVIKRIIVSIIHPLVYLFDSFLQLNYVPIQWKKAVIIPVFKKGNQNNPLNYRPISLTSSFCRIFESILFDKILSHLLHNNLLSPFQFGFLPNRSTCSQILHCLNKWYNAFFSNVNTSIIYTDIAKAFDTVSHEKLVKVISSYKICPTVTHWLKQFLKDRFQQVAIADSVSSPLVVHSGIPQGSVIGPLLFIIFFNDITSCATFLEKNGGISLFADDAKLFSTDEKKLQDSLNCLHSWTTNFQLKLAPHKCFLLTLRKSSNNFQPTNFYLDNHLIQSTDSIKDLGVTISHDLKWAQHINRIFVKASSRSFQILKSFRTKNIFTLLKLFKTYVRPILEFNSPIWSPYLRKDIDKIEQVQKIFTKQAFLRCGISFSSYNDRLSKVSMKSLQYRRVQFDLILIFKIVHGLSDLKFHEFFLLRNTPYAIRGNSLKIETISKFKSSQWHHSFFSRAARCWNLLPDDIATSPSISLFKSKLNSYSLEQIVKSIEKI